MSTETKVVKLGFKPGLFRQSTAFAAEGTWFDCDKVRFRDGRPENIRGSTRYSTSVHVGTGRHIGVWAELNGTKDVALGTEKKLYVNQGGLSYDITPVRTSTVLTNALNTTANSTRIIVSAANHGANTGDYVFFERMSATVGSNVFLNSEYIASVIDANSFNITISTSAAATSSSTGVVTVNYELANGTSVAVAGTGWGVGTWGTGTWGTPRIASGIILDLRTWSFDFWGEYLLACPGRKGKIYVWQPQLGVTTRAVEISAAPSLNDFILVSEEQRHLFAFGTCDETTGIYDPLLFRWSDSENYNTWAASITNAAGALRIVSGSRIMGAIRSRGQIIVWTDTGAHTLRFIGQPFVFSFTDIGDNCGLVGPHAATDAAGTVYWMNDSGFFRYDGAVMRFACPLQRDVFSDINLVQHDKIYAFNNTEFGEVWWLYCSNASNEVDRYVVYNYNDDVWYWGSTTNTVIEANFLLPSALMNRPDSYIYNWEPVSVYVDDGMPYNSFIQSGDFGVADGDDVAFVDRIIPDFRINTTDNINFTIKGKKFPGDSSYVTKGPYVVSTGTRYVRTRLRAREMNLTISCSASGTNWVSGNVRMDIGVDGKR